MSLIARTLIVLAGLTVFAGRPAAAQVAAARIDPANIAQVLVVRGEDESPTPLRTFDGSVVDVAPSASGQLVGAIVAHKPSERGRPRVFRLHILEADGETYRVVEHVQEFVFSPDERFVAVIRGHGYEGGPGFFPECVEILGIHEPDLGPIDGLEKATELTWTVFPNNGLTLLARVYEGESSILEYVVRTRTLVPTEYRGLHFSPDGRFYYLSPGESIRSRICQAGLAYDSCVRVYERDGIRPLSLPLLPSLRRTLGWVGTHSLLLADERTHESVAYDVVDASTTATFEAVDWRWKPKNGLVIRRDQEKPNYRALGTPRIARIQ